MARTGSRIAEAGPNIGRPRPGGTSTRRQPSRPMGEAQPSALASSERLATPEIRIRDETIDLATFLLQCARSLTGDRSDDGSLGFAHIRDRFLRAGLDALEADRQATSWIQVGLGRPPDASLQRSLISHVEDLAGRLLADGTATNFFFMHKAPGLRLRFEAPTDGRDDLERLVYEHVDRWRLAGVVTGSEAGRYEPEVALFGGIDSMPYVHGLFTLDSMLWLRMHAGSSAPAEAADPRWLVSLATIRALFDGLGIEGSEDIGVWGHVRDKAGRQLSNRAAATTTYADIAAALRAL
jgi:thiopeptide-type bacteriocin biosynthesis protein